MKWLVYMYINRFRFNFLSYRKVGSKVVSWKCAEVKNKTLLRIISMEPNQTNWQEYIHQGILILYFEFQYHRSFFNFGNRAADRKIWDWKLKGLKGLSWAQRQRPQNISDFFLCDIAQKYFQSNNRQKMILQYWAKLLSIKHQAKYFSAPSNYFFFEMAGGSFEYLVNVLCPTSLDMLIWSGNGRHATGWEQLPLELNFWMIFGKNKIFKRTSVCLQ